MQMRRRRYSLGELELEVLKTVWEAPGNTVQETASALNQRRRCARTTVLTVIQRLHAKGFLRRRKVQGVFRYWPTSGRDKVLSGLIGRFVDKVLDGSPAAFLAYLADAKELTEEQADALREIVRQLEREEKAG